VTDLQGKFTCQKLHVFIAIEVFKILRLFPVLTSGKTLIDSHRSNYELLAAKIRLAKSQLREILRK